MELRIRMQKNSIFFFDSFIGPRSAELTATGLSCTSLATGADRFTLTATAEATGRRPPPRGSRAPHSLSTQPTECSVGTDQSEIWENDSKCEPPHLWGAVGLSPLESFRRSSALPGSACRPERCADLDSVRGELSRSADFIPGCLMSFPAKFGVATAVET